MATPILATDVDDQLSHLSYGLAILFVMTDWFTDDWHVERRVAIDRTGHDVVCAG